MGKANSRIIKVLAFLALISSYTMEIPYGIKVNASQIDNNVVDTSSNQINGGLNTTYKDYYESGKK